MGYNAAASLNYGYVFDSDDEYKELPWEKPYYWEFEAWYYDKVLKPPYTLDIFDECYQVKEGITKEQKEKYWDEWLDFTKKNPLPINLVQFGTDGCDGYVICVNKTGFIAHDFGYNLITNFDINQEELKKFNDFCKTHLADLIKNKHLGWYLCASYF